MIDFVKPHHRPFFYGLLFHFFKWLREVMRRNSELKYPIRFDSYPIRIDRLQKNLPLRGWMATLFI